MLFLFGRKAGTIYSKECNGNNNIFINLIIIFICSASTIYDDKEKDA